jgi:VWFA-related protein
LKRGGRGWTTLVFVILALVSQIPPGVSQTDREEQPLPVPFVETTGVTLMLLDVEATDSHGRPLRGLRKKDFTVHLDGRLWPIYSVDDSCACQDPPAGDQAATTRSVIGSAAQPTGGGEDLPPTQGGVALQGVAPSVRAEPLLSAAEFVIYIDFSQLQLSGRLRVRNAATTWIRETMRRGERTMIVAYSTGTGLRVIHPFTSDRDALLAALTKAYEGNTFVDEFPDLLENRADECTSYPPLCEHYAYEEFDHGRRSLNALKKFLDRLEEMPGRKTLLYFQENGAMTPGTLYHTETPTQLDNLEEVAAAAASSHTAIYPINSGALPVLIGQHSLSELLERETLAMGSTLSEFTGGRYNHNLSDLSRVIDEAERGCRCLYRIGLRPPDKQVPRIYDVRVSAAGVTLPYQYRVRFMTDADRWMRRAQAVLLNPGEAREIEVGAAIVPVEAGARTWDVSVEVSVATDSLALVPGTAGREGTYEVGALLSRDDGRQPREFLGTFKVRRGRQGETDRIALHRRVLAGVHPARYHLAAFVRDRNVNVFGGAEASIDLPAPRETGVAGPVVMRASRRQLVAALPLSGEVSIEPAATIETGPLPTGPAPNVRGDPLSFDTWICSVGGQPPVRVLRFVSRESLPIFRFEGKDPTQAGRCLHFSDLIDTSLIGAGHYDYHIRWEYRPGAGSNDADAKFDVMDPNAMPGKATKPDM